MAIIKAIATNYGVDATYWRVMKFQDIDVKNSRIIFHLWGWVDKDAHDESKESIDMRTVEVQGQEFAEMAFTITLDGENIYNALKRVCENKALQLEEFSGGEQV